MMNYFIEESRDFGTFSEFDQGVLDFLEKNREEEYRQVLDRLVK